MRILLPIIQFPPDVNPTGLLMAQLCAGLAEYGHEISVITAFPHYENFRVWDEYRGKLAQRETLNGMHVLRLYVYAPGKKTMVNRLVSYLSYNALATLAGTFSRRRWDLILCPNGSFFSGLSSWVLEQIKSASFIYNVQDIYPDVPVRAGQLRNRYAINTLRSVENFMYRKAAHVTVITEAMRDNLLAKGVPGDKLSVIPNFVDIDFIRPLPKDNEFARRYGLQDKFVVTHAGSLGYVYDLDTLLDAARRLSADKDIIFLIVGNGVAKEALVTKARELQLANVRFLPFQPREDLPYLRGASDVQVSLYKSGAANDSFPSKIYEIMASGRPLLASADGDSSVAAAVQMARCGICIRPGDPAALAEAILRLYRNPAERAAMGAEGRRYAEEHHSKNSAVRSYDALFQQIAATKLGVGD
jgi:colanic acid biosynthesis glycosyl transferase WcaI